ncbi:MAG: TOBE domain-containing protein [Sulfurovaceae bacterium]|nr:TOBE domain-containing protein [Sulfurovaceae bacterium]MDD5548208.1 TOBE domain-containing protein [Sulfurovaceae bacterium]
MKTSARNQFEGKIVEFIEGAVMTEVKIEVSDSVHICATITNEGKESLGLNVGNTVGAIVKASSIILSKSKLKTSARNNIQGNVAEVIKGAVNSEVKISIGSSVVCAIVTNESIDDLSIAKGDSIYAIFKASSVILIA